MAVDRLERRLPHEMNALHHHPRDPEEDDVEPGDEDGCGVIACQFACGVAARTHPLIPSLRGRGNIFRPAEGAERPERGGEPGIERSEEHTSELQSLMPISYAEF